jgi:hypothetical protein
MKSVGFRTHRASTGTPEGPVITVGLQLVLALAVVRGVVATAPTHVIFAFVDHFEPVHSQPDPDLTMWVDDYMTMAGRHVDSDGRHPIHSYFVICEPGVTKERLDTTLVRLNKVTYSGYGEVELHLHHGLIDESVRTQEQATVEFLDTLFKAKDEYVRHGALLTAEPRPQFRFAFIHGMWALDNSRLEWWPNVSWPHRAYCGVNREIDLLKQNGCYADFTFPAWGTMEPPVWNSIYYTADDDGPASYQTYSNMSFVESDVPAQDKLMIVEGPNGNANIGILPGNYTDWPSLSRMMGWVGQRIHVGGRGDWVFVKVHTHGCAADLTIPTVWDCFFGYTIDAFYSSLEAFYSGDMYRLHYVSTREMYNMVKAAEAGKTGDPSQYRDFVIPPYANMQVLTPEAFRLVSYDPNEAVIERLEVSRSADLSLKQFTTDSGIFEANELNGYWDESDATRYPGQFGELRLVDATPSRYYRIVAPKPAPAEDLPLTW